MQTGQVIEILQVMGITPGGRIREEWGGGRGGGSEGEGRRMKWREQRMEEGGGNRDKRRGMTESWEEGWSQCYFKAKQLFHLCGKKCTTMGREGPSMSGIIYNDHELTLPPLMFTSIPGVERRCSTQVV